MKERNPDSEQDPEATTFPCEQEWSCNGTPCKPLNGCDPLPNSYLGIYNGFDWDPHPDPSTRFCASGCHVPRGGVKTEDLPAKLAKALVLAEEGDCAWLDCECPVIEDAPADGPTAP